MITDCPSCSRQFRIYAWQLSAAKGTVQCGFCGEQFNALERLHDLPIATKQDLEDIAALDGELEEPQFDIPGAEGNSDGVQYDPDVSEPALEQDEPGDNAIDNESSETYFSEQQDTMLADDERAHEILGTHESQPSRWKIFFWFIAVTLLFIVATTQLVWFNRDRILSAYPEYLPYARKVCERFECKLVRARDIQSIVLLNRDVRDHPRYADTLLVNATMENQSEIIQPYPDLRLTLYNTEGQVTGYRIFKPLEYLDQSIIIEDGMPVKIPVHIILELTGSTSAAVSFEFNFI